MRYPRSLVSITYFDRIPPRSFIPPPECPVHCWSPFASVFNNKRIPWKARCYLKNGSGYQYWCTRRPKSVRSSKDSPFLDIICPVPFLIRNGFTRVWQGGSGWACENAQKESNAIVMLLYFFIYSSRSDPWSTRDASWSVYSLQGLFLTTIIFNISSSMTSWSLMLHLPGTQHNGLIYNPENEIRTTEALEKFIPWKI